MVGLAPIRPAARSTVCSARSIRSAEEEGAAAAAGSCSVRSCAAMVSQLDASGRPRACGSASFSGGFQAPFPWRGPQAALKRPCRSDRVTQD